MFSVLKPKVEIETAKSYLAPLCAWCWSAWVQGEVDYLGVKQVAYRKKEKVCSRGDVHVHTWAGLVQPKEQGLDGIHEQVVRD